MNMKLQMACGVLLAGATSYQMHAVEGTEIAKSKTANAVDAKKEADKPTLSASFASGVPGIMGDVKSAIGCVDVYKVFQKSEQAREDEKRIIGECEAKKKVIEDSYGRLRKLQEELQAMKDTATDAAKERKIEEGRELQKSIEVKTQGLEEYQARAAQEAQMRLLKEVEESTEEVRKERGLVVVFAGGTLAADPSIDISSVVVERMNKKHAAKKERQAPSRVVS